MNWFLLGMGNIDIYVSEKTGLSIEDKVKFARQMYLIFEIKEYVGVFLFLNALKKEHLNLK